jgi:hypothetical protein
MFFKKVINIIISLIIPFGYTTITKSSSIKNATITSFQKISLNTVFSSIADYQCLVKPTAEDVINYLAQNVSTSYSDILDNIQIDSISDSRVVFSALPYSYRYIGTLTFNYRIANKVSLKSVFNVSSSNQTIDINDNFNYDFLEVNTITKFLQKLKPLYPTLDINQLVVTSDTSFPTIKDNATNRYLVSLSPAVNNIYYVEDNSFIINFIFDGRGFNDFTIVNGNFNVQYNSSITSQLAINDILPIADSYTYSLTSSLPSSVLSVTDFGMITMNSFNDLTLQSGHVIDYSITAIATKAEYSNKSITTSFTITIIASEDTE